MKHTACANPTRPIIGTPGNDKRSVALKLSIVARQLRVTFDQSAEASGLTRAQWQLIAVVARNPGATQRTIAEALEVREITAGRLVDRLCDEGYLRRDECPTDRRAYSVYLTAAAQPVLDKLDELAKVHETAIFAGFDTEDLQRLDAVLDAIVRNLSDFRNHRAAASRLPDKPRLPEE
ncbi:MAG: winged helix DNA-binding domain protein [Gammaproteobacteria bacterium]|nr:winged helix DNA-binding domain protein [Gammaproteobacteria bacterium]